jgi:hypothetical protein
VATAAPGETEFRALTPAELRVCSAAAQACGARLADLAGDTGVVDELHRRGLLYFDVPIRPDDHVSIPPLEARPPSGRGAAMRHLTLAPTYPLAQARQGG